MSDRPHQFTLRALFVTTAAISIFLGLWMWLINPVTRHRKARDEMDVAILSLSTKCPPELTAAQWAYCIGWTCNLHANYGYFQAISARDLERITRDLRKRVDEGPDLSTID